MSEMLNQIILGDCLDVMQQIPDHSIDMILCDLPYGTTACKWDAIIPFEPLWANYKRLIKPNGAIVLTASQPFTSALVSSNFKMFKYCWVWDKVNKYTGALNANKMPLKRHEDIAVFYSSLPVYNKQFRKGSAYRTIQTKGHGDYTEYGNDGRSRVCESDGNHNPCSVIQVPADVKKELGLHPTQKPVALFEYLIKTYTNEGETVLDNCIGSGTTAIACINTKRNFIGIEKDPKYHQIAVDRVNKERLRLIEVEG